MCFDRNINGNTDYKIFDWDYWSLHHWPKKLTLARRKTDFGFFFLSLELFLKVNWFQNDFWRLRFLPKNQQTNSSYYYDDLFFGRNRRHLKSFRSYLTFSDMKQSAFDCARKNTIRDSSHFFTTLFSEPITNNYMKIDMYCHW